MTDWKRLRWVALVLAVFLAGAVTLVLIDALTPDSDIHAAQVEIRHPTEQLLTAQSKSLLVTVGGVETCVGEDGKQPELDRFEVEQAQREITIRASLRVFERGGPSCEVSFANVPQVVDLDRPLGNRVVIDDSREEHRVISSPAIRDEFARASRRTLQEATRFIAEEFPAGEEPYCLRSAPHGFFCSYHKGPNRTFLDVLVRPNGEFAIAPVPEITVR